MGIARSENRRITGAIPVRLNCGEWGFTMKFIAKHISFQEIDGAFVFALGDKSVCPGEEQPEVYALIQLGMREIKIAASDLRVCTLQQVAARMMDMGFLATRLLWCETTPAPSAIIANSDDADWRSFTGVSVIRADLLHKWRRAVSVSLPARRKK
jgi:hypothetical protein